MPVLEQTGVARRDRFGHYFLAPDKGLLSFLSLNATFVSIPVLPEAAPTFHWPVGVSLRTAAGRAETGDHSSRLGTPITIALLAVADPQDRGRRARGCSTWIAWDAGLEHFPRRPEARSEPACGQEYGRGSVRRTFADVHRSAVALRASGVRWR